MRARYGGQTMNPLAQQNPRTATMLAPTPSHPLRFPLISPHRRHFRLLLDNLHRNSRGPSAAMPGLANVISPKRVVTEPPPPKKRSWRDWKLKSPFRKKHAPDCVQHTAEANSGRLLNLPGVTKYAEKNARHCTTPSRAVSDAGHKFHNASPCQNSHITDRLGLSPRPILKSKSLGTKNGLGFTGMQGEEVYFGYDAYEALEQRKMRIGQPFGEKLHYKSPLLRGERLFQLTVNLPRTSFHKNDCCSEYEDDSDPSEEDATIRPRTAEAEKSPYLFPRSTTEASGNKGLGMIRSPELVQLPRSNTQEVLGQIFDKPDDLDSVTFQRYSDLVRKQGRYSGGAGKKHLGTSDYESTPTPVSRVTRSPRGKKGTTQCSTILYSLHFSCDANGCHRIDRYVLPSIPSSPEVPIR
jgi:hypothetical protein